MTGIALALTSALFRDALPAALRQVCRKEFLMCNSALRCVPLFRLGKSCYTAFMKVVVLSNQARSLVNFWSVLLTRLREAGHETVCFVPGEDTEAETELAALGARVCRYPLDRKGLNPFRDLCSIAALYRLFLQERPDVLYATTIKPVIYGLPAAARCGVKRRYAMITGLGYMFEADTPVKKLLRYAASRLYRFSLSFADAVFFQNGDDVAEFRARRCLPPAVHVVPTRGTGVDTARFAPVGLPDGPPVFLFVGRLLEAKGLPEYAEAARRLRSGYPKVRFQVLGPPEEQRGGVPVAQIRRWEAEGLLEYLGETRDTRPFVARASVIVLPSRREGMPCALMEGMSMGRAVTAADAPGCREVVRDGINGFLVPPGDPAALASALERFLLDPSLIARFGAAGRHMAETELDAGQAAEHLLRVMELLPEGRHKPADSAAARVAASATVAGDGHADQ